MWSYVYGYLKKWEKNPLFSLKPRYICWVFDWKQQAWQTTGSTDSSLGSSGSEISLLDLNLKSWNNASWHSGMQRRRTQPKWTVTWKTLFESISAWGKTPIHDCPLSSQVSGCRLKPKYNHERKQLSSRVNSWNSKALPTCSLAVWVYFTLWHYHLALAQYGKLSVAVLGWAVHTVQQRKTIIFTTF